MFTTNHTQDSCESVALTPNVWLSAGQSAPARQLLTTAAISAPVLWLMQASTSEDKKKKRVLAAVLTRSCSRRHEHMVGQGRVSRYSEVDSSLWKHFLFLFARHQHLDSVCNLLKQLSCTLVEMFRGFWGSAYISVVPCVGLRIGPQSSQVLQFILVQLTTYTHMPHGLHPAQNLDVLERQFMRMCRMMCKMLPPSGPFLLLSSPANYGGLHTNLLLHWFIWRCEYSS